MTKKTHLLSGLILVEAVMATHFPASIGVSGLTQPAALAAIMPASGAALVGSLFPDIDILFGPRDRWNSFHRTLFHWPPLYAIVGLLLYFFVHPAFIWFAIGCFMHLFLDAMTRAGIPVWRPFGKREGLRLIGTGKLGEVPVYAGLFIAFFFILKLWLGKGV
jgi:membrane-bound metal-dependent hydrolase YbcI (DUF457 family)